ncbi:MAG: hypothetical protein ACI8YP_001318 [Algoriphagus sp.]|jgi:hypothetical protein
MKQTNSDEGLAELILGSSSPLLQSDKLEILLPLLPGIVNELRKKGMTRQRPWESYKLKNPDGFQSSQFPKHIREDLGRQGLTMHFEHQAGEKVFIDYAGKKLYVIDPHTGEQFAVEVFVATLGCNQYTYLEATYTQRNPTSLEAAGGCWNFSAVYPELLYQTTSGQQLPKAEKIRLS